MRASNRESNSNSNAAKTITRQLFVRLKGELEFGVQLERGGLERGKTGRFLYVHPKINKGGIQRKHISFLWLGREGHN